MPEIESLTEIRDVLARTRTIAVLGAHHPPSRPALSVLGLGQVAR